MSQVWVDIERLVLDGVSFGPATGGIAALTQAELERLLRERGISARLRGGGGTRENEAQTYGAQMKSSPGADEARWANELAEILYRAIDRSA